MKRIFRYITSAMAVAALGITLTACDDWTDTESIDLNYGTTDTADPEAYAKYTANLRAYRQLPHTLVYAWVDNAAAGFGSQAHRLTALPDSIDVIVLQNVTNLTDQMMEDMKQVREVKGMQIIYCIDYAAIKADWTLKCEELAAKRLAFVSENGDEAEIPAELQDPDFKEFMTQAWSDQLAYFNAGGFDGLMAAFDGKGTTYMSEEEKQEYYAQANLFMGIMNDWHKRNPGKVIDYFGTPEYTTDMAVAADFRTMFISATATATSANQLSLYLEGAKTTVAVEKLGAAAYIHAIDTDADPKTGFYADGTAAIDGLTGWAPSHHLGAVGVFNIANDYYLTAGQYSSVRKLIQAVNPVIK